MLCLYIEAPFAVFRPFTAGSFRPTADFITPSAVYGLLLNIAGIEMRFLDETKSMTLIKAEGLPKIKLALAAPLDEKNPNKISLPFKHSLFQQLHNYPVGNTGKERAGDTKGTKYNIQPVRRSFLSRLKSYIMFESTEEFENRFLEGINGRFQERYGVLFLGDNNFLVDKLNIVQKTGPLFWYVRITNDTGGIIDNAVRMTITVDRFDMSRTQTALFAPISEPLEVPPDSAWVEVAY